MNITIFAFFLLVNIGFNLYFYRLGKIHGKRESELDILYIKMKEFNRGLFYNFDSTKKYLINTLEEYVNSKPN